MLSAFVALLICSMAILSCGKKFPVQYIYETDVKSGVCGKYKITDPEKLKIEHVEELPLESCHGVFGFATRDVSKVINWSRDRIAERCK